MWISVLKFNLLPKFSTFVDHPVTIKDAMVNQRYAFTLLCEFILSHLNHSLFFVWKFQASSTVGWAIWFRKELQSRANGCGWAGTKCSRWRLWLSLSKWRMQWNATYLGWPVTWSTRLQRFELVNCDFLNFTLALMREPLIKLFLQIQFPRKAGNYSHIIQ